MDYTVNVGSASPLELAEEVVSSAIRVLLLAGFGKTDIADFFRQTAGTLNDEIDNDSETGRAMQSIPEDDGYFYENETDKLYQLEREFTDLECNKKLERLNKRSKALVEIDDTEKIIKAGKIIVDAVPLRLEAMAWLKTRVGELGFALHNSKIEWIENADDEDLDHEENHIFIDDYRWRQPFGWVILGTLARKFALLGQIEALDTLYLLSCIEGLFIDEYILSNVKEARDSAAFYVQFKDHVSGFSGHGEQMQSEFIDGFTRRMGGVQTMYINEWLDRMAAEGRIERYKRSNRWRVLVP